MSAVLTYVLLFLIGFAVGAVLAWAYAATRTAASRAAAEELRRQNETLLPQLDQLRTTLQQEQQLRVEAQTRLQQQEQNLQQQRDLLQQAEQKLTDTFKALAGTTLETTNKSFLDLAGQTLRNLLTEAKGDLTHRQQAIDALVKPLQESLQRVENARQEAYGQLRQQMTQIGSTQQTLQRETANLVTALRNPQVRGRWGELTLRRVAELTGMSRYCDFVEQASVPTDAARLRPDMVVNLPAGRQVVVDSKVPLTAYLEATTLPAEPDRQAALANHARHVRSHVDRLALKEYWDQFPHAPEFVVLFLPGECFFSAALESQPDLIEYGVQRRVVLASPTTLITLLHAVAYGWRESQMAENARHIAALAKDLYDRVRTFAQHMDDIRTGLDRTITAYNHAVGSLESRLHPAARRFKDLGVPAADEVPTLQPIQAAPRAPQLFDDQAPPADAPPSQGGVGGG